MKLRNRLTLLISLAAVGAVLATIAAESFRRTAMEEEFNSRLIEQHQVMWEQISSRQTEELQRHITSISGDSEILAALRVGDTEILGLLSSGAFEAAQTDIFTRLQLTNAQGELVYSSHSEHDMVSQALVQAVIDSAEAQQGFVTLSNGQPLSVIATPLFDFTHDQQFVGVNLMMSDLSAALNDYTEVTGNAAFIVSPKGAVFPADEVEMYDAFDLAMPTAGESDSLMAKQDGTVYRVHTFSLRNFQGLPAGHFITAVDSTEAVSQQANRSMISMSIIVLGLVIVIASIVAYMKKMFAPIDELTKTVERLGEGDTKARIKNTSNDEIGQLGKVFNKMAQRVEDLVEKERQAAEDIAGKVELIEEVVDMASKGDLTGQLMVYRDQDVISELANGIQGMMDSLNSLVASIQKSGIQVTSSATEIAATAKQQEATVSEQAATTNEIRATVTQISATSKELVQTMNEVTEVALQTSEKANSGRSSLERMGGTMHHMMEATSNINSKLAVLSEKAANINTVVTTINKVADQTNLLSLNAAIEAEKAGEYGVGFAVVATEIRRLADQTAVATWDIEQMVKEMQSAVSAGVMGMEKFSTEVRQGVDEVREVGAQLGQIIEQVENLIPRFEDVHEGMQSQSQGAQQISDSMIQLAESSQQTADSLRQSNGAIQQLNDAARRLQTGVSHFKVSSGEDSV